MLIAARGSLELKALTLSGSTSPSEKEGAAKMLIRGSIVTTWNAKQHEIRHIINGKVPKALGTLKTNRSMGRAVPRLMKGRAMRLAAVGTSRVSKGG